MGLTCSWALSQTSATPWVALPQQEQAVPLEQFLQLAEGDRLLSVSETFLGVPYVFSPLGEGEGVDPDPLIRFDAVDCLTFVEQVMAIASTPEPSGLTEHLSAIRYRDTVDYEARNHLMEADWIPNNVNKGFLVDVTHQYGGDAVMTDFKRLTANTWKSRSSKRLALPETRHVQGQFPIHYIPLEKAPPILAKVPSGTLLMVVREERETMPTRVTHLGFLIQKKRLVLRHASKSFGKVVDEDFASFLARNRRYEKWKVVGFSLFQVQSGRRPSFDVP